MLTVSPKADADNAGQFVIVAKDTKAREKLTRELNDELAEEFPMVQANIQTIQTGPPADYPIMLKVTGRTVDEAKELANAVADRVSSDPNVYGVNMDWGTKTKVMHLELDQDKLHAMGLTSEAVSQMLYTEITGATAAQFYTGDRTVDIDLRLAPEERPRKAARPARLSRQCRIRASRGDCEDILQCRRRIDKAHRYASYHHGAGKCTQWDGK